jgi:predicted TIM-barrel fold metal-dependent hydrolase
MGGAKRYPSITVHEVDGFREGLNPSYGLNLLEAWVPDEAQRRRILVDNASSLYGFES